MKNRYFKIGAIVTVVVIAAVTLYWSVDDTVTATNPVQDEVQAQLERVERVTKDTEVALAELEEAKLEHKTKMEAYIKQLEAYVAVTSVVNEKLDKRVGFAE